MRLLQLIEPSKVNLTRDLIEKNIPAYAILSHTWGHEDDEVTFSDVAAENYSDKEGFLKIQFCGNQAEHDGLRYFWVDSCCIDKSSSAELTEAITSMFKWYKQAAKCYVHLADVFHWDDFGGNDEQWNTMFRESRWFTRGWTLQELLAPASVEFFSKDGKHLGDRHSLESLIHQATTIPVAVLRGDPISGFDVEERFRWAEKRTTTRELDGIYCLQGLLDVFLVPMYGESKENAYDRLSAEIERRSKKRATGQTEKEAERVSKRPRVELSQSDLNPNHRFSGEEKKELIEALYFDRIDDRRANIKPGLAKTCKWITQHEKYRTWLDHTQRTAHCGVLWIKGKPGCGKSTLMKFLLAKLTRSLPKTRFLSFFFNARGESLERTTLGLYRSLLLQLLNSCADTNQLWNIQFLSFKPLLNRLQNNVEKLKELFIDAVRLLDQIDTTILVDALDECDDDEIRDMIGFFEKLGAEANDEGKMFRVLFSSRHYPYLTIPNSLNLIVEDEIGHTQDIQEYVAQEFRAGKTREMQLIREEICKRASGVFLWVLLVVQILNKYHDDGHIHSLRQKLKEIPTNLRELFRNILLRDRDHLDEVKLCLQWVLFANRPLKREELYYAILSGSGPEEITRWDPDIVTTDIMNRFILSSSKGLVEVTKTKGHTVQFIHETVRDYLLKQDGLRQVLEVSEDPALGLAHDVLRKCCQNYLVSPSIKQELGEVPLPKPKSDDGKELRRQSSASFPLLDYSAQNVFLHASRAQTHGISQLSFLQGFELGYWVQLNNLLEKHEVRRYPTDIDFLYIFANEGNTDLISVVAQNFPLVRSQRGRYGNPVFAAVAQGHCETLEALITGDDGRKGQSVDFPYQSTNPLETLLRMSSQTLIDKCLSFYRFCTIDVDSYLLEAIKQGNGKRVQLMLGQGADVNAEDGLGHHTLQTASMYGHKEIAQMLLDAGADVNADGGSYGSVLQAALTHGYKEVVQMLLDAGADVNADGGYHGSALQMASMYGYKEIAQMLLDAGADVNADGGSYGSALHAASINDHKEVVRLLLNAGASR